MRHRVATAEARNHTEDASFVGVFEHFDDVAPFVHGSIVLVHLHGRSGDCSEGEGR